jgi:hypothetical protein
MKIPKKYIHQSGPQKGKINLRLVQTNLKTLERGDPHPTIAGLVFIRYRTDRGGLEHWNTTEFRQNYNARTNDCTRKWRENNPERYEKSWRSTQAKRRANGKDAEYKSRPEVKKNYVLRTQKWRKRHPEKAKEVTRKASKNWREKNLKKWLETGDNHLKVNLRACIYRAVKNQYSEKAYKSMELLGCTIQELRDHLESQFTEGMTWDNMGRGGWHIDHIIPCAFFDLTKPSHQKVCFNWQNLQPLWESDNCAKGDKIPWYVLLTILKYNYKTITL